MRKPLYSFPFNSVCNRNKIFFLTLSLFAWPGYFLNNYIIQDLQSVQFVEFEQEANHWTCSMNSSCYLVSEVAQYPSSPTGLIYLPSRLYLAGQALINHEFFERLYTGLDSHLSVGITLTLILMPSNLNVNRYFHISLDGQLNHLAHLGQLNPIDVNDFPGPVSLRIRFNKAHNDPYLKLQIMACTTNLDNTFGFRDITISLSNQTASTSYPFCLQTDHPKLSSSTKCFCPLNQARVAGTCVDCLSNCGVCSNESPNICIECKLPTSWNGTHCTEDCHSSCEKCYGTESHQCIVCKAGYYNFKNGTCSSTCSGEFVMRYQGSQIICERKCNSGYIWSNNAFCVSSCEFPFQSYSNEYNTSWCKNPSCQNDTDYLYMNGTCLSICLFPLVIHEDPGVRYCVKPCVGDEAYFNGSCLSSCPLLLTEKEEQDVKYCFNSCEATGDFLYFNRSCLPSCPFPLMIQEELGVKYCINPCEATGNFLYYNGSCLSTCPFPLVSKLVPEAKYCLDCSSQSNLCISKEDVQEAQQAAETISILGGISGSGMKAGNALNSNSPNFITLSQISTMLLYIRYLKINYPMKLMLLFSSQNSSSVSMSFGFNLPLAIENNLPSQKLPEVFEKYQVHSSFLINFWDPLATLITVVGLTLLLIILSSLTRKFKRLHFILNKAVEAAKWSFPLLVICGSFSDVVFYATLEFRTIYFDSAAPVMSFLICLSMIALIFWVFFKALSIVIKMRKNLKRFLGRKSNITNKWKDYQILFSEYKDDSFLKLAFMPVFLMRSASFHFIIATLYNSPLTQVSLLTLLSILMLTYLLTQKPLKNRLELVQLCLNEIIVMLVNICVMILAILDAKGLHALDARETIGQIILKINMIFTALGVFFLGIQVLIYIQKFRQFIKELKMKTTLKQFSKESSLHLKVHPKQSKKIRIIRRIDFQVKVHKIPKHLGMNNRKLAFSNETKDPQSKSIPKVGNFLIQPRRLKEYNLTNNSSGKNYLQEITNPRGLKNFRNIYDDQTKGKFNKFINP